MDLGRKHTSSDSEVETPFDSSIHSIIESARLATTERHVSDGALVLGLAGRLEFCASSSILLLCLAGGEVDTRNDIGHGTGAVRAEDLDSNHVRLLGDTVTLRSNGTRAVSSVTIVVNVLVVLGNGLPPRGTALELVVLDVDAGIDDVDINAVATKRLVLVLGEGAERQLGAMADAGETLSCE